MSSTKRRLAHLLGDAIPICPMLLVVSLEHGSNQVVHPIVNFFDVSQNLVRNTRI